MLEQVNTPVRLLGAGVSGLEEPDDQGIDYDTVAQKALDKTLDEINRRYGENKVTHARALRKAKNTKPG